ncbi:MAG: YiiD C-terminal domain-containing protein [Dysgonamonadaceae bacterium]|jgi:type I restriction-modification system DNA methylase subunit|nr:YiiD C-terminal domain-containing protein [Dysgonamonadaceae bacterium]
MYYCKQSKLTALPSVVRKVEIKYRKPVTTTVFSKAKFQDSEKREVLELLNQKGSGLLKVEVSLFDEESNHVMQSIFEWFITICGFGTFAMCGRTRSEK